MRRLTLTVTPEQAGRTVKSLLRRELRMADGAIARVKTVPDGICLNGAHARTVDRVAAGDTLTVRIDDKRPGGRFPPVAVPLDILYEDADLLALNKPAGMTAHASNFLPDTPTVAGALAYQRGPDFIFHVVNRLDKGTTGLMAVAKSGYIHDRLRRTLHTDGFSREYRAVCVGCPKPPAGTIDAPIGRDETSAVRRMVRSDGQRAVSHYEVLSQRDGLSFVKLQPETGRTHQLRVHMAHIGCPLAGDWLYGTEDPDLISRPALHAYALALTHPVTGTHLYFTAPTPADMEKLI